MIVTKSHKLPKPAYQCLLSAKDKKALHKYWYQIRLVSADTKAMFQYQYGDLKKVELELSKKQHFSPTTKTTSFTLLPTQLLEKLSIAAHAGNTKFSGLF